MRKMAALCDCSVPVFVALRDPILVLLTWVNHRGEHYQSHHHIDLRTNLKRAFDDFSFHTAGFEEGRMVRVDGKRPHPRSVSFYLGVMTLHSRLKYFKERGFELIYYDMEELAADRVLAEVPKLARRLGFGVDEGELWGLSLRSKNGSDTAVWELPRTLHCFTNEAERELGIRIFISTFDWREGYEGWRDLSAEFLEENRFNLVFLCEEEKWALLRENENLMEKTKRYCRYFERALERRLEYKRSILVKPSELVEFLLEEVVGEELFGLLEAEFAPVLEECGGFAW